MARFVVAALEGDFCDRLADIARECGRRPAGEVRVFAGWAAAPPPADRKDELGAAVSGSWTVLADDWGVTADLFDKPKLGAGLAAKYRTRVVAAFADAATGECGYRLFSPEGVRGVFITPEGVAEDVGEPFPGEGTPEYEVTVVEPIAPATAATATEAAGLDGAAGGPAEQRYVRYVAEPEEAAASIVEWAAAMRQRTPLDSPRSATPFPPSGCYRAHRNGSPSYWRTGCTHSCRMSTTTRGTASSYR